MDWSDCPDTECFPGKVSGTWLVRGTRIPADAIVANAEDGYTPEEIATLVFEGLTVDRVRRLLAFAQQRHALAS